MSGVLRADASVGLGWPTVGWMHAAFRLMSRFEDPDFPRAIMTPALVIASGADRVTDTRACERFSERLRAGRLIVIDGAEHEIMMERDLFRDQFWAAFDAFIPGVEGERAQVSEPKRDGDDAARQFALATIGAFALARLAMMATLGLGRDESLYDRHFAQARAVLFRPSPAASMDRAFRALWRSAKRSGRACRSSRCSR